MIFRQPPWKHLKTTVTCFLDFLVSKCTNIPRQGAAGWRDMSGLQLGNGVSDLLHWQLVAAAIQQAANCDRTFGHEWPRSSKGDWLRTASLFKFTSLKKKNIASWFLALLNPWWGHPLLGKSTEAAWGHFFLVAFVDPFAVSIPVVVGVVTCCCLVLLYYGMLYDMCVWPVC